MTYVVQRAESLMGLRYLLVLYGLRGLPAARQAGVRRCAGLSLGMAMKEVMASAPLMALLYHRTFWPPSASPPLAVGLLFGLGRHLARV